MNVLGELALGIIKGLAEAVSEGVAASKEKTEELYVRVEELLRRGADAVAMARVGFSQGDAETADSFVEARKRLAGG